MGDHLEWILSPFLYITPFIFVVLVTDKFDDLVRSLKRRISVIPGLTKPAPYLIRGDPVLSTNYKFSGLRFPPE